MSQRILLVLLLSFIGTELKKEVYHMRGIQTPTSFFNDARDVTCRSDPRLLSGFRTP